MLRARNGDPKQARVAAAAPQATGTATPALPPLHGVSFGRAVTSTADVSAPAMLGALAATRRGPSPTPAGVPHPISLPTLQTRAAAYAPALRRADGERSPPSSPRSELSQASSKHSSEHASREDLRSPGAGGESDRESDASPHSLSLSSSRMSSVTGTSEALDDRCVELLMRQMNIRIPPPTAGQEELHAALKMAYYRTIKLYLSTLERTLDSVMIVNLQTGIILYCNTKTQHIFGVLRKELIFRSVLDFLDLVDAEKQRLLENLQSVLNFGQSHREEGTKTIFTHDGILTGWFHNGVGYEKRRIKLEYYCSYLADNITLDIEETPPIGVFIFRHYQPREDILRGQRLAKSIFSHSPIGMVQADFTGTIHDVNPAVLEMFNLFRSCTLGQNVSMFTPPEIRKHHDFYMQRFREKYAAEGPGYQSCIVGKERTLRTKTWFGKDLSVGLRLEIVEDNVLIAFIRNTDTLVSGADHRRALVKKTFPSGLARKYFGKEVPKSKEGLHVNIKSRPVMSIDLVNSTQKFQVYEAEEHYKIMNGFLTMLDDVISVFQGTTIKHTGDGLLAIFDPIFMEAKSPIFALQCAVICLARAKEWSAKSPIKLKTDDASFFDIRIGISTGNFTVGVVGSAQHLSDVDITGDTVVKACRLQSVAESATVVVDTNTFRHIKPGALRSRFREKASFLKGYETSTETTYAAPIEDFVKGELDDIWEKGQELLRKTQEFERCREAISTGLAL